MNEFLKILSEWAIQIKYQMNRKLTEQKNLNNEIKDIIYKINKFKNGMWEK